VQLKSLRKLVVYLSVGTWAILVTLVVAVGASIMSAGNQNDNAGIVANGEEVMGVAGGLVVLLLLASFARGRYFGHPHLLLDKPTIEPVGKKRLPLLYSSCEVCNGGVGRTTFMFRVDVINEFVCAISRVRLYCEYEGDSSYFLRMRHDNQYRRSDVGELVAPNEKAVFDFATVVTATTCGICGANLDAIVEIQYADFTLPRMFTLTVRSGDGLSVNLTASGLQPNREAITPTLAKAVIKFSNDDSDLSLTKIKNGVREREKWYRSRGIMSSSEK
jgi:hypothetical protein